MMNKNEGWIGLTSAVLLLSLFLVAGGCSGTSLGFSVVDECEEDKDCSGGEECLRGKCRDIEREDGDQSSNDGDRTTDGDGINPPDGDTPPDGDPPDGDDMPDGDTVPDGDLPPDGDGPPDGDEPPDGDNPPDGDPEDSCDNSSDCDLGFVCNDGHCIEGCFNERDCLNNWFCLSPAPGELGVCVECIDTGDCDPDLTCIENRCRFICMTDDDCSGQPGNPYCDENGLCVVCMNDAHCSIGNLCIDHDCVAGCRGDRDCPNSLVCDSRDGEHGGCFSCVSDAHCEEPLVCRDHECVVDCSDIECPAGTPHCLPEDGSCVECTQKRHCGNGQVCLDQECVPGCEEDSDCPGDKYCRHTGTGVCVDCLEDDHCSGDLICVGGTCRDSGCTDDADCDGDQYCHPNLAQCTDLPPSFCDNDEDCFAFPLALEMCDPLTRVCIPNCALGLPICLFGGDRIWCIDNGCYECQDDSYCQGVLCDPFDWMCVNCANDSDCRYDSWHCNQNTGECWECLNSGHCTGSEICNPDNNRCVECLDDDDCDGASKPDCGKDHTCIPACSDECVEEARQCDPQDVDGYQSCGDWDNDSCLEYGGAYDCPSGQTCSSGECVCVDECEEGSGYCDGEDDYLLIECVADSYGCFYYSERTCESSTICDTGECACEFHCSHMAERCIEGDPTHFERCVGNSFTECYYWALRTCPSGAQCIGNQLCTSE